MNTNKQSRSKPMSVASKSTTKFPTKLLHPHLAKAVRDGARILNDLTENELDRRYALGVLIRDAMANTTYGDAALAAFAEKLCVDENTLYAHAAVVRAWPSRSQYVALTKRRGENMNYRLTWSHLVLLAGVDKSKRKDLIGAAFAEELSVRELRTLHSGDAETTTEGEPIILIGDVVTAARDVQAASSHLQSLLSAEGEEDAPTIEQLRAAEQLLAGVEYVLLVVRARLAHAERLAAARAQGAAPDRGPAPVQMPAPVQVPEPVEAQAPVQAPVQARPLVQAPAPVQVPTVYQQPAPVLGPPSVPTNDHQPAPPFQVPAPVQVQFGVQAPAPFQAPSPVQATALTRETLTKI